MIRSDTLNGTEYFDVDNLGSLVEIPLMKLYFDACASLAAERSAARDVG